MDIFVPSQPIQCMYCIRLNHDHWPMFCINYPLFILKKKKKEKMSNVPNGFDFFNAERLARLNQMIEKVEDISSNKYSFSEEQKHASFSKEQKHAIQCVVDGENIFITGPAGTGKTLLLNGECQLIYAII
jgi:DNA replication protein DnaC